VVCSQAPVDEDNKTLEMSERENEIYQRFLFWGQVGAVKEREEE